MSKIKIVTDSTCDLSQEEAQKLNIHVIPLSITIQGETYLDRVDITPTTFMNKMKAADELPKSSQPAVGEFLKLYDELGADGSEILSIHLSGKLSGTIESARSAANMTTTKVTIIDSSFITKALAFQVREAAKMAEEGKLMEDILAEIEKIRLGTKLYVIVDTLENLVKGGRIGKGRAMIGSLLNIKPIALLEDGEYSPVAKVRSKTQAVKYVIKHFMEDINGKTLKSLSICHADGLELAHLCKEKVAELTGIIDIEITDTTPVISTHTGPGAIGFMYYTE
ncbi:DegV family protein [Lederbergia citri]|uniref:DegV family protein n=1 Tax=Lederbergia citri TaxID=2833580 RepID=A0A942TAU4_9BACI|nr:DegV family protein [Lederbergia citri]MBS4194426.1 DegV family protein [Lederbergia citri]